MAEFLSRNWNVDLLFCSSEDDQDLERWNPVIRPYPVKGQISRILKLIYLLSTRRYALVYTYAGYRENIILALFCILCRTKYIIKSDSKLHYALKSIRAHFSKYINFLIPGWFAEIVIVESERLYNAALKFYPKKKLYLLLNGIDVTELGNISNVLDQEGAGRCNNRLLICGRITYQKGLDTLLPIFKDFLRRNPKWKLLVVGPVEDEAYYASCTELISHLGLQQSIEIKPAMFGLDLHRLYRTSDIMVMPSRWEGLPNIIPEAYYFGLPVVAFDCGEVATILSNKTGRLVPAGDLDKFLAALLEIAGSSVLRKEMELYNHQYAIDHFDNSKILPAFVDRCESASIGAQL